MADRTKIEYANASWLPTSGSAPGFRHPERLEIPLHWRKPRRITVGCDLFDEAIPDEFIDQVMDTIMSCELQSVRSRHTFLILTKWAQRMRDYFATWAERNLPEEGRDDAPWPLKNLWLGVSVTNQDDADERIPLLLSTPAAVRWVSVEPMGVVDLYASLFGEQYRWQGEHPDIPGMNTLHFVDGLGYGIDWVVCGGETGPEARPMHPDWVRSLRDQCQAAGVPFFFRGWGEWWPYFANDDESKVYEFADGETSTSEQGVPPVGLPAYERHSFKTHEWPEHAERESSDGAAVSVRVGKRRAGRLLDGRTWDDLPASPSAP